MAEFTIEGEDMQHLHVRLSPGESIYADAGHLVSKDFRISMNTVVRGGLLAGLKRVLTGSSFFVTELTGPGEVVLAAAFPGKVFPVELEGSRGILAESHSFLAAEPGVQYEAQLAKLGAGILAGEGLFLARFSGRGRIYLHAYGGLIVRDLKPGEALQVEAGHLLAFEEGMKYSALRVGGIRSMLFSGEGMFFVQVEGPGRVYIHTVTAQQLAGVLVPYLPRQGGSGIQIGI
ncbi:MAG: TIGR00266 family protein [Conexivisphaera sp.]